MTTYSERYRLWTAVVDAYRNQHNLQEVTLQVECLGARLEEREDVEFESPLSPELVSLLTRAKRLFDDFSQHEDEIDDLLQRVAWAFAAAEWDLRRGDRIECTNWKKVKQVLSADTLYVRESDTGELSLQGRIIKKDGEPGKKEDWLQLLHQEWTNLSKQQRQTAEPATAPYSEPAARSPQG